MGMITPIQLCDGSVLKLEQLKALIGTEKGWRDDDHKVINFHGYESCFAPLGFNVVEWICCGSYQGDYVVLLEKNGRFYFSVIGYGSCSGCDHYQAYFGYDDKLDTDGCWSQVASFIEEYHGSMRGFDTLDELQAYLKECLVEGSDCNDWYLYDEEKRQAFSKIARGEYSD
jgi:hypothetical protein